MLIYKDLYTQDELFSDALPQKLIDGVVYKVEGKYITEGGDIGVANNDEDGAGLDDQVQRVINVISTHKLQEVKITKKDYMNQIKGYMGKLVEEAKKLNKSADEIKALQTSLQNRVKDILGRFDEFNFYVGENSLDFTGMLIPNDFSEDGLTPYFYFWKLGLEEEKF